MGSPILYGLTVLRSAPHPTNAMLFAEFLIDPKKGLLIFEKSGNNVISPIPTRNYERIPENLKKYASPFEIKGKKPFQENINPTQKPVK